LRAILESIIANPAQRIDELPMLSDAERAQLLYKWNGQWNETAVEFDQSQTIHQLFEAQAARAPEAIALKYEDEQLSYRELNSRANQLARYLQAQGVSAETVVGICLERSLEMIIAMLGVLKAGGAYLPIEPDTPGERIAYMAADAGMKLMFSDEKQWQDL